MANLEFIRYIPVREITNGDSLSWELDKMAKVVDGLPQLYWGDGLPWSEANHWALTKVRSMRGNSLKTTVALLKHLSHYASWLEHSKLDWRHFPEEAASRPIVQFRGELIRQRDELGLLMPSTATARMSAVLQFYRHAQVHGFVQRNSPLWIDRQVVHGFYSNTGFARTMLVTVSELAIPNRGRYGDVLEDGLTPLRPEHASELLEFTKQQELMELHYLLSLGFLSGGRFGTLATLKVRHIEEAVTDYSMQGFRRIRVGPGTGVKTKYDVSGDLLVPSFLIEALKGYAYSMQRLRRQAKASPEHKDLLFLTARGNPYSLQSFSRLMTDLRRRALVAGLLFMQS
ncbi:site-specific integrase, partial [Comamonas jiangduensis]|uniref:site-specific integrase n=1 Tax=Comamonas jiangduensis TaxID=1194168 RepID=UPI003BF8DA63